MTANTLDPDEFPVIGEPLPVEFANSLYVAQDETIDFLATSAQIRVWFDLAMPDDGFPVKIRRADGDAIRELRNVVHDVLRSLANDRTPTSDALAMLNRYAGRAPWFLRLTWSDDGPVVTAEHHGNAVAAVLGRIANEAIELIGGPSRLLLRQCRGPGCAMLFVKNHHKRRWCHHSCGHRARQAKYYRRNHPVKSQALAP